MLLAPLVKHALVHDVDQACFEVILSDDAHQ